MHDITFISLFADFSNKNVQRAARSSEGHICFELLSSMNSFEVNLSYLMLMLLKCLQSSVISGINVAVIIFIGIDNAWGMIWIDSLRSKLKYLIRNFTWLYVLTLNLNYIILIGGRARWWNSAITEDFFPFLLRMNLFDLNY